MRKIFLFLLLCASLKAFLPIPLPVTDAKAIQQVTKLSTEVGQLEGSAATHWAKEVAQQTGARAHWGETNAFYKEANELYDKIIKALKNQNVKLEDIKIMTEKLDNKMRDLLDKRNYAEIVTTGEYGFDIIIEYCESLDEKRKLACYNDLGVAGNKLDIQRIANEYYTDITKKNYPKLNKARTSSEDIKSSIDVNNAIRQNFLEIDLKELEKEISQMTASNKYDLELQSATNQTLKDINKKIDMSKIVKAKSK